MSDALAEEGIMLLLNSKISDFNYWRMKKNLTIKLDISNRNFSGKDLSNAYLNGVSCIGTDFSNCNLSKVNFVQANLAKANFKGANMSDVKIANLDKKAAYLKYAKLEGTPWQE